MNVSPDEVRDDHSSVEDDIRAAMTSLSPADDAEPPTDPQPEGEPAAEEPEVKAGAERDEHGRFKPKEAKEETVESAEPVAEQATEEEKPQPDPYGLAPQYAGPAIKGKWSDLPPDVREEIVKRDREVHQTFTRFDEERNFGKQIKEIAKPYEALITSLGANVPTAVDYLLKTDFVLRTGTPEAKRSALLKAAQDYGIDLPGAQEPAQTQPQANPDIEPLQQRIIRLEQERNNDIQSRRDEEQRTIQGQIESFASRPENVYFQRVAPTMAALMQSGQAESLEKAYEMAVYADPETRALHLAATRDAEERKRTGEKAAQAAKARQASPSITGAPGSAVPPQMNGSSGSIEDDLRAAFQQVAGRA